MGGCIDRVRLDGLTQTGMELLVLKRRAQVPEGLD